MTLSSPGTRVVGACLLDARERQMMLPEQGADALGIDVPSLLAIEEGHRRIRPEALDTLTGLYRYTGTQALRRLLAQHLDHAGVVRDQEPGHAERLAACVDSASGVRWQSTVFLPGPLQTPAYAHAVDQVPVPRPGAPRQPGGSAVYLVDERVIQRSSDDAELVAEQLEHLLRLLDSGTDIRVIPATCPVPQPAGHLVELHLPGGPVWARPGPDRVDYCATLGFAEAITNTLTGTDPGISREALSCAAAAHRALAPSPRRAPSPTGNPPTPADRPVPSSPRRAP
ncbi:Scr1 family TA system antitoxin-like transcriptional regulator [Streptomyces californicus]|uniref:Scr1 family TA system antitoxin-like transcriptional regulator n=1 Tax=Streptomyces californicus TaxID=67351 RepID=UPI00296F9C8E|nr:Scr1 family TA system antitoxin-like transcriptional regulator [Streptomyces californicus]MDW4916282.1 Scr1 family TA system antitoxin-like transcriptional regulator [Streptomyces californicus]